MKSSTATPLKWHNRGYAAPPKRPHLAPAGADPLFHKAVNMSSPFEAMLSAGGIQAHQDTDPSVLIGQVDVGLIHTIRV
jgi:hypothetical protein